MSFKVVITDCTMPDTGIERAVLSEIGADVIRLQLKTPDEIVAAARDADALMVQWLPITKEIIEQLEHCRVISRYGIGVDMIDVATAESHGIRVIANAEYCLEEVAEHALALTLACARKIAPAIVAIREGNWNKRSFMKPLRRLSEQTLGIVGYGRIGRQLARMASPLMQSVIAYDPFASGENILLPLDELLRQSDFISLHCPLTDSTRNMIDRTALGKMKSTAWLINTSRGQLVDEAALVNALQTGTIAGAALDVFAQEPVPTDHPLLSLPNVLATPHVAWYSERAYHLLQENTARAVVDCLKASVQ